MRIKKYCYPNMHSNILYLSLKMKLCNYLIPKETYVYVSFLNLFKIHTNISKE